MKTCCAVVVGHVDHGKTALVRALTGIDTDSLAEEKARGLSITPGFAYCSYPEGILDLIDAPGHEDFIPAMVSGTSGAQAALLVVAADEGISAQTREHLGIMEFLGLREVVVVITKSDSTEPARWQALETNLKETLSGGPFAASPIVCCSARTGAGMDELNAALRHLLNCAAGKAVGPPAPFLPIDRVFSMPGQGTVVTGTLLGADLSLDEECYLLPGRLRVSLRGLQSRGEARMRIGKGERAAVNLRGVPRSEVTRGMVLSAEEDLEPSSLVDAKLRLSSGASAPLRHMEEVRILFGTTSEVACLSLFGKRQLMPGEEGHAQLRFARPVVSFAGQAALLRRLSPAETLGGALILDPCARYARGGDRTRLQVLEEASNGRRGGLVEALARQGRGAFRLSDLMRLARLPEQKAESWIAADTVQIKAGLHARLEEVEHCKEQIRRGLIAQHAANPFRSYVKEEALALHRFSPELVTFCIEALVSGQELRRKRQGIALAKHDPLQNLEPAAREQLNAIERAILEGQLDPPKVSDLSLDRLGEDLLDLLIDQGRVVALTNVALGQVVILHALTLAEAQKHLKRAFGHEHQFRTGEAREALGTSRRVVVPLLEYLDGAGLTRRQGNRRTLVR